MHIAPPPPLSTHYQSLSFCLLLSLSLSQRLSGEQTEGEGERERDVSLGQFVLTYRDAQVAERCQTTKSEREG